MVLNQASLKRDGVQDYVSLRASAIVLALYSYLRFLPLYPRGYFRSMAGVICQYTDESLHFTRPDLNCHPHPYWFVAGTD